jgi:hypothetical protein
MITNNVTTERYVGITVIRKCKRGKNNTIESLAQRWEGHLRKAFVELKDWTMPTSIREHGADAFTKEILEIVRGKATAHTREVELINALRPELNTKKQRA